MIVQIIILLYCVNIILGLFPLFIIEFNGFDRKYKIDTSSIWQLLGGLAYWILYPIYRLIRLPKDSKKRVKEKAEEEYENMRTNAYRFFYECSLPEGTYDLLYDCKRTLDELLENKYFHINTAHNNKPEKLFIKTVLKIKEVFNQYDKNSILDVMDKIELTLNKLKNTLDSELKKYEDEYSNIIKQDKINIEKELDNINKEMDYYVEFNEKYYK